jgi:hypothetical protein
MSRGGEVGTLGIEVPDRLGWFIQRKFDLNRENPLAITT